MLELVGERITRVNNLINEQLKQDVVSKSTLEYLRGRKYELLQLKKFLKKEKKNVN